MTTQTWVEMKHKKLDMTAKQGTNYCPVQKKCEKCRDALEIAPTKSHVIICAARRHDHKGGKK